ncbi:nitrogen fixation protein FixH [Ottowia sp.]|uniref:nitrogen fixation protein FixH n=1 Tax=Ottowia sp. TaxID=1898956 RepID=UPI0039E51EEE
MRPTSAPPAPQPWWKYGHMWLVVGGPLIVVVASFVTLYLAIRTPDPVYADAARARPAGEADLTPAMQARNHAATGGVAPKAAASGAAAALP